MDASANAKARTLNPEDFLDNSFLRELENSASWKISIDKYSEYGGRVWRIPKARLYR